MLAIPALGTQSAQLSRIHIDLVNQVVVGMRALAMTVQHFLNRGRTFEELLSLTKQEYERPIHHIKRDWISERLPDK